MLRSEGCDGWPWVLAKVAFSESCFSERLLFSESWFPDFVSGFSRTTFTGHRVNSATLVHFLTVSLVLLVASARGVGRAGAFRIAERVCTGHNRESRCNK
jgi:hypothetical protein